MTGLDGSRITARNYAAQAHVGLKAFLKSIEGGKNHALKKDAPLIRWIAEQIPKSQHFAIPDSLQIFGDELKGLESLSEVRLPFESITIEAAFDNEVLEPALEAWNQCSKKVCVLAFECEMVTDTLRACGEALATAIEQVHEEYDCPAIIAIPINDSGHIWAPLPCAAVKPTVLKPQEKWTDHIGVCTMPDLDNFAVATDVALNGLSQYEAREENTQLIKLQAQHALYMTLELVEALTCSNVQYESLPIKRRLAGSTRRKRKVPLYETKVLTLNMPSAAKCSEGPGEGKTSPRAHLRRGHIRRLPKGNVWVNACAVGKVKDGFLHKDYAVKAD